MAARRCTLCGVNYPDISQFAKCPIHDEETDRVRDEPDADWQARLASIKARLDRADELARAIPLVHNVVPYIEHGLAWIDHTTLMDAGLRIPQRTSFALLELDDGFIYETQGFDVPARRWWVERVDEAVPIAS